MIGLETARSFYSRIPQWVDEFIEFPGFPGIHEDAIEIRKIAPFIEVCQDKSFDAILQMSDGVDTIAQALMEVLGVKQIITRGPALNTFENEVAKSLELVGVLTGESAISRDLYFPLVDSDHLAANALLESRNIKRNEYICFHPSADCHNECWPLPFFAMVANALAWMGFKIIITGAEGDEQINRAFALTIRASSLDVSRLRIPYETQASILQGARLMIANESYLSVLAAAVGVSSVVLVGEGTETSRARPSARSSTRLAPLNPFLHRGLSSPVGVHPEDVIEAARRLLKLMPEAPSACPG